MKPYNQHDPVADKGKAIPHPKRPTTYSRSGKIMCFVYKRKNPEPHNNFQARSQVFHGVPSPHSKDGRRIKRLARIEKRYYVRTNKLLS